MTKNMRLEKGLLKIGEVASEAKVTVSMIKHYTELGLLKAKEFTESGYRLYEKGETLEVMEMIMIAKSKQPSLSEIKASFEGMG